MFRLEQIGQIAVPVSDIDRSIAFYRDTLGMQFLFGPVLADCGGVRLMLASLPKTAGKVLSSTGPDTGGVRSSQPGGSFLKRSPSMAQVAGSYVDGLFRTRKPARQARVARCSRLFTPDGLTVDIVAR
ncbi:MAG: VOC family protein [Acidobacteria bacterium]|nr:VOC family protein [Acidobacteriota bacterium]